MKNIVNWFEIPVADLARARRFYEQLLGTELKQEKFEGLQMAIFPHSGSGVGGALVVDPKRKPATDGTLVYLNANGTLDACVARAPEAGGTVILPKTDIGPPGYIALVKDPEGNTVGLHAERAS